MHSAIQPIAVVPLVDKKSSSLYPRFYLMGCERVRHSLPSSLSAGFWLKAYNITSDVADTVVEVANAVLVNGSIKVISNIIACFLFILTNSLDMNVRILN